MKTTDMISLARISKTRGLPCINYFLEVTMKECILNIQFLKWSFFGNTKKNNMYSSCFDEWVECFMKVNPRFLPKTYSNR